MGLTHAFRPVTVRSSRSEAAPMTSRSAKCRAPTTKSIRSRRRSSERKSAGRMCLCPLAPRGQRAHAEISDEADGTEEECQQEARDREEVRDAADGGVARFPGAHEEVEGQVMDP